MVGKNASPERSFLLNGTVPFSEARSLTLPKNWKSYRSDAKDVLTATYQPSKKISKDAAKLAENLAQVRSEGRRRRVWSLIPMKPVRCCISSSRMW